MTRRSVAVIGAGVAGLIRPLASHEVIVQTITAATTPTQDDQEAIREIRQLLQQARHTTYPGIYPGPTSQSPNTMAVA